MFQTDISKIPYRYNLSGKYYHFHLTMHIISYQWH